MLSTPYFSAGVHLLGGGLATLALGLDLRVSLIFLTV